MNAKP